MFYTLEVLIVNPRESAENWWLELKERAAGSLIMQRTERKI